MQPWQPALLLSPTLSHAHSLTAISRALRAFCLLARQFNRWRVRMPLLTGVYVLCGPTEKSGDKSMGAWQGGAAILQQTLPIHPLHSHVCPEGMLPRWLESCHECTVLGTCWRPLPHWALQLCGHPAYTMLTMRRDVCAVGAREDVKCAVRGWVHVASFSFNAV